MGGWLITNISDKNYDSGIQRFKSKFNIGGVPPLFVDEKRHGDWKILLWSWSAPPVPDIEFLFNEKDNTSLLIHGVITGIASQENPAKNVDLKANLILDLCRQQGESSLRHINGSFSLAIINVKENLISLITDRFASRPVWTTHDNGAWIVGNYPAAMATMYCGNLKLNGLGLWSLLANSRHIDRDGLYYGFKNLHGGEIATIYLNKDIKIRKWFDFKFKPDRNINIRDWGDSIANALRNSAQNILHNSDNIHLFLSGGLDSRIAAGSFYPHEINTITLTTHPNMNSRLASATASLLKFDHQTLIRDSYWYLNSFNAASLVAGGNYNILHAHFVQPIQAIAKKFDRTTFMVGDLLENFNKHYFRLPHEEILSLTPHQIPDVIHQLFPYSHKRPNSLMSLFNNDHVDSIYQNWRENLISFTEKIWNPSDDIRDRMDIMFRWYNSSLCPTYLMLESIHPFSEERNLMFDNQMADMLFNTPAEIRGAGLLHNSVMSHLNKFLLFIPDSNFWLPPIAPEFLRQSTKRIRPILGNLRRKLLSTKMKGRPAVKTEGSWHILHEWFRKDDKYKNFVQNCLFSEEAFPPDIFNRKNIEMSWNEFLNGDLSYANEIYMLLSFGLLHRQIPTSGIVY